MQVAVIGDPVRGFTPQEAIAESLAHTGADVTVRWCDTPSLALDPGIIDGADGVWCAPGSPFRSLDGAVAGIRRARQAGTPFIGTCAGFQHGVIEFARSVLGEPDAGHAEYGATDTLFVAELACSLVGQTLRLELTDERVRGWYGAGEVEERYYCRFGLNEAYLPRLGAAGLRQAGVDAADRGTRILVLDDHPFFVLTLFVPQTRSTPDRPHPLIGAFVETMAGR